MSAYACSATLSATETQDTREREREREREEILVRGIEWQRGKIHSEAGRECLNREYLKGPVKVLLLRY